MIHSNALDLIPDTSTLCFLPCVAKNLSLNFKESAFDFVDFSLFSCFINLCSEFFLYFILLPLNLIGSPFSSCELKSLI